MYTVLALSIVYLIHYLSPVVTASHHIRTHATYESLATFQLHNNHIHRVNYSITPPFHYQSVPPTWPQSWKIADSTAIYACNYTGSFDPDFIKQFAFVGIDWSHSKQLWANQAPMTAEQSLVDQVNAIKANRPDTVIMIYRNTVKALAWFRYVQTKVNDPLYAGFFLSFRNDTNDTVSPKCDINTSPLKCTDLYHDQMQSPQYKIIDDGQNGTCYPLPCDAGNVPSGEYLFDFRNASARGYIIEDLIGPSCFGNLNVSGVYLDDYYINSQEPIHPDWNQPPWGYCTHSPIGGPSEIQLNCTQDMQLLQSDMNELYAGWQTSLNAMYNAMDDAGVFAYQSFSFISTPDPSSIQSSLQSACAAGNASNYYTSPLMHTFTTPPACCPANRNTTLLQFNEDLAFFMLIRGPSAYLGYGWDFCSPYHEMPSALFIDYGNPLNTCQESSHNYFTRSFTNATVWFNTTSYTGGITMNSDVANE